MLFSCPKTNHFNDKFCPKLTVKLLSPSQALQWIDYFLAFPNILMFLFFVRLFVCLVVVFLVFVCLLFFWLVLFLNFNELAVLLGWRGCGVSNTLLDCSWFLCCYCFVLFGLLVCFVFYVNIFSVFFSLLLKILNTSTLIG